MTLAILSFLTFAQPIAEAKAEAGMPLEVTIELRLEFVRPPATIAVNDDGSWSCDVDCIAEVRVIEPDDTAVADVDHD